MPVVVVCPSCKARMKAPDNLIGKTVKCPGCAALVQVKAAPSAPAPAPAPAPVVKKPAPKPVEEVEEVAPIEDGEEAAAPPPGGPSTDKERSTAMWIHLLPVLLGWCCGIGNFIPLFLWISKRKESAFIDHHGKTWLNWFINLFVLGFVLGIIYGVLTGIASFLPDVVKMIVAGLLGLLYLAVLVAIVVMEIMIALKAKKGEWAEYRVLFKVLK